MSKEQKQVILAEGYILDRATNKPVDGRKPEEKIRQEYELELHENYGYDYKQMDIEVPIQRGEKNNPKNINEKADMVIYKTCDSNKRDQNKDILGIIETKRPSKKDGLKQLMSYMSATCCNWGVWTNGEGTEYVYHDLKTGECKTDYIYHIPSQGETFEDIGRLTKKTLQPVKTLKPIFKRILYTLYSNTNISRKEKLGNEMTRLIFCKIYDEKYDLDSPPQFKIGFDDTPEAVKKRVVELWKKVQEELSDDGVFEKYEKIVLDPKSIMYIVGELEKFSLLKTDKDVVGDAFEVFAERQFVGEKGEFFTPREVVKMAIGIINPQPKEYVLDPACGSGGFLIYALEHVWNQMEESPKYRSDEINNIKRDFAQKYFYGIDKEIDLVKICKAYMSIIGDGRSNIAKADSLKSPKDWEDTAKNIFTKDDQIKTFDVILTNPPFGSNIKIKHKEILDNYELGHKWRKNKETGKWEKTNATKETEPQILFVELCLNLLKDGGRLAIVLPDGVFGNPTDSYIREWIKEKAEIVAVIDCPHTTFMPHTHTKTSVLILKKWEKVKKTNYPILFSIVEKCGHDNRGKDLYIKDKNGAEVKDEEFSKAVKIYYDNENRIIKNYNRLGFTQYEGKLKRGILIPRYYNPDTIKELEQIEKSGRYELKSIKKLVDEDILKVRNAPSTIESREYNIYGEVPFLRTSDLGAYEPRNDAVQKVSREIYLRYKEKQNLKEGDVLFVKDGTYRIGETAILTKYDLEMLVQSHFLILRSLDNDKINPYLLLYLLNVPIVRKQISEKTFVQATLSTIGERFYEVVLPIPLDMNERNKRAQILQSKISARATLKNEIKEMF